MKHKKFKEKRTNGEGVDYFACKICVLEDSTMRFSSQKALYDHLNDCKEQHDSVKKRSFRKKYLHYCDCHAWYWKKVKAKSCHETMTWKNKKGKEKKTQGQ